MCAGVCVCACVHAYLIVAILAQLWVISARKLAKRSVKHLAQRTNLACLTCPERTCLREKQPSGVHGSISHVGGRRILMPSETKFELTSFVESNSAGAQSKGGESKPVSFHLDWWTQVMKTEQFCICSRFSSKWTWTKGRIRMNKAGWTLRRRDRCELWVNNIGHILFTHCIAYSVCGAFGHI